MYFYVFLVVLLFDPKSPAPVAMVADMECGDSLITDMIFIPPFDNIYDDWPTTGQIYFLNQNSVCILT